MAPAVVMDGKAVAARVRAEVKARAAEFSRARDRAPGLAVIRVGSDPASAIYVRHKRLACADTGIVSFAFDLPETSARETLRAQVTALNRDPRVDGILVQLPLPKHLDADEIMDLIDPAKDVDGFNPYNTGLLAQKRPRLRPCTPYGVIRLAEDYGIALAGLRATVVGASNIVGRPMALELMLAGATVTVCHSRTRDLRAEVERAEVLVAAVGRPGMIPGHWIRPGAAVFDVGINRTDTGRLVGDVEFETAVERAAYITPVPGGIGPMTIAMLLSNTLDAAMALAAPHAHAD
jgi:methylenetetrahydrofolate dehydrogenase (NADP+)/methenyltetrahydrofolate cyclohydrolase